MAARFATPANALRPPYPEARSGGSRRKRRCASRCDRRARPGDRGRAGRRGRPRVPRGGTTPHPPRLALQAGDRGRRRRSPRRHGDHARASELEEREHRRGAGLAMRAAPPYLRRHGNPSPDSRARAPRSRDLRGFLRQRSREQVIGATLAVLVTIIIVIVFFVDSKINTAPPPHDRLCRESTRPTAPTPRSSPTRRSDQAEREAARRKQQRQIPEAGKAARH